MNLFKDKLHLNNAIIFDFDGVILDSVHVKTEAFVSMYAQHGKVVQNKVLKYHLAHGGISRYKKLKYWHEQYLGIKLDDQELEVLSCEFSDRVLERVIASEYIKGAKEFLNRYSKDISFYVCTGTPQKEIDIIIKEKLLKKHFVAVYGSPKSKEEIIEIIIEKFEHPQESLLFVGDAMTDYNAAINTNIDFVGVQNENTSFPDNTKLIGSIMELIDFIDYEC